VRLRSRHFVLKPSDKIQLPCHRLPHRKACFGRKT
jgi:hypothetical protein